MMEPGDLNPNDPDYYVKIQSQMIMWNQEAEQGLIIEVDQVFYQYKRYFYVYLATSPNPVE